MLTQCLECKSTISDQATACPKCGRPMSSPVLIEQTAKRWKVHLMISAGVIAVGTLTTLVGILETSAVRGMPTFGVVALVITILALMWHLTIRARSYWHHG